MDNAAVTYTLEGTTAVVRFDDGKVNAISHAVLDALEAAVDRADADKATAFVIAGREGKFSAGFDLSVMRQGIEAAMGLAHRGGLLAERLFRAPRPVILAVTGHAMAMGAILLLAADVRIGADGPFKIGLNEVMIGFPVPEFAMVLANDRLSRRHIYRATTLGEIYGPKDAVDAGYLDQVVAPEQVVATALGMAKALGEAIKPIAYIPTKRFLRAEVQAAVRKTLGLPD